jgi:hypothetical protein
VALGDSYASVREMKARLTLEDEVEDVQLEAALVAASRGIEKMCGRQFNDAGVASARLYRSERSSVNVDDFHSTVGLVVATDVTGDGTYGTAWGSAAYELYPLNGVVDGESGWPWSRIRAGFAGCMVQVTARWGWATVPAAVKESCLVSAVEIFKLKDTPFGVGGYGDFGIIRARDNPFVARMLAPYVRHPWLAA